MRLCAENRLMIAALMSLASSPPKVFGPVAGADAKFAGLHLLVRQMSVNGLRYSRCPMDVGRTDRSGPGRVGFSEDRPVSALLPVVVAVLAGAEAGATSHGCGVASLLTRRSTVHESPLIEGPR